MNHYHPPRTEPEVAPSPETISVTPLGKPDHVARFKQQQRQQASPPRVDPGPARWWAEARKRTRALRADTPSIRRPLQPFSADSVPNGLGRGRWSTNRATQFNHCRGRSSLQRPSVAQAVDQVPILTEIGELSCVTLPKNILGQVSITAACVNIGAKVSDLGEYSSHAARLRICGLTPGSTLLQLRESRSLAGSWSKS